MVTVYGQPAVEVANPDGAVVPYVCRPVPAKSGEWRAWEIVKDDGTTYTVSEYPSGRWSCTCPHWQYRGRFKCEPDGTSDDKHIAAVRESLNAQTEATSRATADTTTGH